MFRHFARGVSRPAAAAVTAAAAANASQGTVQARAPPQGARQATAHPLSAHDKIIDRDTEGWVVAELKDEVVLFQPFDGKEVDEAASTVMALWGGRPMASPTTNPIVTEPGEDVYDGRSSDSSTGTGDDRKANAVIEAAAAGTADAAMLTARSREQRELQQLMTITTRMLRRPGMQRELVMCMLEDEEVRELMLRQCDDLDRYLAAAGITTPGLLPPAEIITFTSGDDISPGGAGASAAAEPKTARGPSLVDRVAGALANALERAGGALKCVSNWLRAHLDQLRAGIMSGVRGGASEEEVEEAGRSGGAREQRNQVLSSVMVLALAVICIAVIRRPLVLRIFSAGVAAHAAAKQAELKRPSTGLHEI